jgi:hypothetical protein
MRSPAMDQDAIERAAAYLAEAFETGNALAELPEGLRPPDLASGEEIAGTVLDRLGFAVCGLRLAPGPGGAMIAGPLLAGRILHHPRRIAGIAPVTVRHARLSAAALGVLADALEPGSDAPPVLAAVHAALDIAASRFAEGPADAACHAADLGGIGYVVTGAPGAPPREDPRAACAPAGRRPRGVPAGLAAGFAAAAAAARDLGGLPAGALLLVAGLTTPAVPQEGEEWVARLGRAGAARARYGLPPAEG